MRNTNDTDAIKRYCLAQLSIRDLRIQCGLYPTFHDLPYSLLLLLGSAGDGTSSREEIHARFGGSLRRVDYALSQLRSSGLIMSQRAKGSDTRHRPIRLTPAGQKHLQKQIDVTVAALTRQQS